MISKANKIRNIKPVKALRGDPLSIDLGTTFTGTVTAWMKKSPNDSTYREFTILNGRYLTMTGAETSDFYSGSQLIEAVEGKWYFDVEFTSTKPGAVASTIYTGTVLFYNDVTNSEGVQASPVGEDQQTPFTIPINQVAHGFTVGQVIKFNGTNYILAQADSESNAGAIGLVRTIIDTDNFTYQFGGLYVEGSWSDGDSYFLSVDNAGEAILQPSYITGDYKQFIGTAIEEGLIINIDYGTSFSAAESAVNSILAGDGIEVDQPFGIVTITNKTPIPIGGLEKMTLQKLSDSDYDYGWVIPEESGTVLEQTIIQTSHSLSVGDGILFDGVDYVKAQADAVATSGIIGVVKSITDANTFTFQYGGVMTEGTWIAGVDYFLSTQTAGLIDSEGAFLIGQVRVYVGQATAEGLLINIDIGQEITDQSGGTGQDNTFQEVLDNDNTTTTEALFQSGAGLKFDNEIPFTSIADSTIGIYNVTSEPEGRIAGVYSELIRTETNGSFEWSYGAVHNLTVSSDQDSYVVYGKLGLTTVKDGLGVPSYVYANQSKALMASNNVSGSGVVQKVNGVYSKATIDGAFNGTVNSLEGIFTEIESLNDDVTVNQASGVYSIINNKGGIFGDGVNGGSYAYIGTIQPSAGTTNLGGAFMSFVGNTLLETQASTDEKWYALKSQVDIKSVLAGTIQAKSLRISSDDNFPFKTSPSDFYSELTSGTLTDNRIYTFKDEDGTVAFLSDINIAIPLNEIAVGSGTGIQSDSNFTFDGSSFEVIGNTTTEATGNTIGFRYEDNYTTNSTGTRDHYAISNVITSNGSGGNFGFIADNLYYNDYSSNDFDWFVGRNSNSRFVNTKIGGVHGGFSGGETVMDFRSGQPGTGTVDYAYGGYDVLKMNSKHTFGVGIGGRSKIDIGASATVTKAYGHQIDINEHASHAMGVGSSMLKLTGTVQPASIANGFKVIDSLIDAPSTFVGSIEAKNFIEGATYSGTSTAITTLDLDAIGGSHYQVLSVNTDIQFSNTPAEGQTLVKNLEVVSTVAESLSFSTATKIIGDFISDGVTVNLVTVNFANYPTIGLRITVLINQ